MTKLGCRGLDIIQHTLRKSGESRPGSPRRIAGTSRMRPWVLEGYQPRACGSYRHTDRARHFCHE